MTTLNVLLVTYGFPPLGGVGVLRATSLARYLPAEGIRLDVLTARNASAVGADPGLLKGIPPEVIIHRTLALDVPFGFKKAVKKLIVGITPSPSGLPTGAHDKARRRASTIRDILLPDPQIGWLPTLARKARHIIRSRNIALVIVTVPPYSSLLLIEKLRNDFPHLPIVADFRDEWLSTTINLVSFSRSPRARVVAQRVEASAVANATVVVAVTEAARREMRMRYPQEADWKFQVIPNGFDRKTLQGLPKDISRRDPIILTYIGNIYRSTNPASLVEALETLSSEVRSRFRLRFIGHIEEEGFRQGLLQLGEVVQLRDFIPQDKALEALREGDYALLITHDPVNVSAKFYDYAGVGTPILALVHPDGEVRRLLEELRAGWWADINDVADIRRLFLEAATVENPLLKSFRPDRAKIAQYERKALAHRYATLLYSVANTSRESEFA
jgi:glycosyltransferase involved in cell wall biosynthesis